MKAIPIQSADNSFQYLRTGLENPREQRRFSRKKVAYIEPTEEPGTIYEAKVHSSSQRLLYIHRITKYVKFCHCCALPAETVGAVEPYTCGDGVMNFGFPIYLYFYYMKFCIVMAIIISLLSSVPTIVFSTRYTNHLKDFCNREFNITETNGTSGIGGIFAINKRKLHVYDIENNEKYIEECFYFSSDAEKYDDPEMQELSESDEPKIDYLSFMSASHILRYRNIFAYNTKSEDSSEENQQDIMEKIFVNYSLMYFETAITVLIASFLLNLHVNMLSDYEDFKTTTPADYAVLVHGVTPPKGEYSMRNQIIGIINQVSAYTQCPMIPFQIIPCIRIGDIFDKEKKKFELETKLYHVENLEPQRKLNLEKGYSAEKNNLCYFDTFGCFHKSTPVTEIKADIEKLNNELSQLQIDLNNNPNSLNGGTYFILFPQIKMRDDFYDFFPHSYGTKILTTLKYILQTCLCRCCFNNEQRALTAFKLSIDVEKATEPYDVEWEHMGYSRCYRNSFRIISIVFSLVLIAVVCAIVYGLDVAKNSIKGKSGFASVVLSLLISIIIAIARAIGKVCLEKITFLERMEGRTDFMISFSVKFIIFDFIIVAILPVFSNYITGGWGYNDLLYEDIFYIYLLNILLGPVLFYFGPDLAIKILYRSRAEYELKNIKYEKSIYTQGELNEWYENPKMDIGYKYCFITNVMLISLFYMPIFPLGMIIGVFALLFALLTEFFFIGYYKRPEILNSNLALFFIGNVKWALFIFALGNYIFVGTLYEEQARGWPLIFLIVIFILCLLPYEAIRFNLLGITEGETKSVSYAQNAVYFSCDYEKLNPLTRKQGYINYFNYLNHKCIIDPGECAKIIDFVEKQNEFASYVHLKRNITNYTASHLQNDLLMRRKIDHKMYNLIETRQMLDENTKDSIDLKGSIRSKKQLSYDQLAQMKEYLTEYYQTTVGISGALIFLGIRGYDNYDNLTHYQRNYNPWKIEWIFTPLLLRQRKKYILDVRKCMDYTGEISDDEDSFINYDATEDQITAKIKNINKLNDIADKNLGVAEKKIEREQTYIDNEELISTKVFLHQKTYPNTTVNNTNSNDGANCSNYPLNNNINNPLKNQGPFSYN